MSFAAIVAMHYFNIANPNLQHALVIVMYSIRHLYLYMTLLLIIILDLIILNVLIYKAKTQRHLLHLVMDVASVQDMYSHMLKSVHFSLFYYNSLL